MTSCETNHLTDEADLNPARAVYHNNNTSCNNNVSNLPPVFFFIFYFTASATMFLIWSLCIRVGCVNFCNVRVNFNVYLCMLAPFGVSKMVFFSQI